VLNFVPVASPGQAGGLARDDSTLRAHNGLPTGHPRLSEKVDILSAELDMRPRAQRGYPLFMLVQPARLADGTFNCGPTAVYLTYGTLHELVHMSLST
jgi:hypothetical protein